MKKRLTAFLVFSLFWLFFFIFARMIFLLAQFRELITYSPSIILGTFTHGFRLDLATTGYIMIIPLLLSVAEIFFPGRWYITFMKLYTITLLIIFSGFVLSDAVIYSYWGFRLEFSVLDYLKKPLDAMASASTIQMILFFIAIAVMTSLFLWIYNRVADRLFKKNEKSTKPLLSSIFFLILTVLMIIPIRGGLGVAPLNAGSVYFSESLFPNHAAINIIWNFVHTAIYSKPVKNPYIFDKAEKASETVAELLKDNGSPEKVINSARPNILLIILESFGSYLTEQSDPGQIITPRFREYIPQGLYFTNIFAAGSRTDKAIPAIFSGYPNLPAIQVIRDPKKTQSMPGIINMLDSAGYHSSFWYGGDIDFANLNSYLTTSGFREKITKKDFKPSECNSKWGAHDEVLLNRLLDSLPSFRHPFVCSVLTLSSHEPFEVPMETVFKGDDAFSKFKNSVYYTDRSLGNFLDKAKTSEWWKNTLVILIADHCRRNTERVPVYSEEIFKIPMLWLGGALSVKNEKINKTGNQFDLPLTIANQLGLRGRFKFSKDLLSPSSSSFAFYTYNEGFAFITDTATSIYDIKLKKNVFESGRGSVNAEKYGKSFLQELFDDYLSR